MKRLFKGHINFGRIAALTDRGIAEGMSEAIDARPNYLRWFCGMHDLDAAIISRPL